MRTLSFCLLIFLDVVISTESLSNFIWSEWEPWITCSRTCGGGVSYQLRGCLRGTCRGPAIQYKTCNTQECPPDATDFRAQQCAAYNDVQYRDSRYYEWEPIDNLPRSSLCTLTCKAKGQDIIQVFSPKVLDGTQCTKNSRDMCINGKCEPVGCDYQLNSTAIEDRCGVCNGDNTTCKLMKGNNVVSSRAGIKDVYEIPPGSHSIRITNKGASFLGIREKDGNNGFNQRVATPLYQAQYTIAGATVMYTRLRSGREHIDIKDPLQQPIVITLLFTNPFTTNKDRFHYQYIVPLEYVWQTGGWSSCTATCGGGDEVSVVVCLEVSTGRHVSDTNCEGRRPDFERRRCNEITCPPMWQPDPWEPCSRTCGGGIQTRRVYCVQKAPQGMMMRISQMTCSGQMPPQQQACNMEMCPHWFPGPWSQSSATCGRGVCNREVLCQDVSGLLADGCDPREKPAITRECLVPIPCMRKPEIQADQFTPSTRMNVQPLNDTPSWQPKNWGDCSGTCSPGLRIREVFCQVLIIAWDEIVTLPDEECKGQQKPAEFEVCEIEESNALVAPCGSATETPYSSSSVDVPTPFDWRYAGYTQCSASCLGGFQESIVECFNIFDSSTVSEIFCNFNTKLPSVRKVCNEVPCPPEWMIPLYEECSATCGGGFQRPKIVMCMEMRARGAGNTHVLSDDSCQGPKPSDAAPCNEVDCPPFWLVGPWSQCSVTCDNCTITRSVRCLQITGTGHEIEVNSVLCPQPAPSTHELYVQEKCKTPAKWKTMHWSECSASCGEATRVRTIMCIEDKTTGPKPIPIDIRECPADSRPIDSEPCRLPDCIEPIILANRTVIHQQTPVSKMRLSVGSEAYIFERTTITVKCPVLNFKKSEIIWERGLTPLLPSNSTRIKINKGGVLRIRNIRKNDSGVYACRAGSARETFALSVVDGSTPLGGDESASAKPILGKASWNSEPWTLCTATCGGGTQARSVKCEKMTIGGRKILNNWHCKEAEPETKRECNTQACVDHWATTPWSECGGPRDCLGPNESTRIRDVFCEAADRERIPSHKCDEKLKPANIEGCQSQQCRPVWEASDWSMCTATCGMQAIKTRKIQCVFKGKQLVADTKWCDSSTQPSIVQRCNLAICPNAPCIDQSDYCSLIKRINMCSLAVYQDQCCQSCTGKG